MGNIMRITTLDDGKYTIHHDNGNLTLLRHGDTWPAADDLRHSGVVLSLVQRIEELEDLLQAAYQPDDLQPGSVL